MEISFWTKVIMAVLVLHFVGGFGYLIYKLSPQKGDKEIEIKKENES